MRFDRFPRAAFACLLALTPAAGCGGRDTANDEADPSADAPAEGEAAPPSGAPAGDPSAAITAPVTVADLDRWQKGMAGELAAVREGAAKMKSAKTNEDTLSAMMAVQETATREAGAKAAGLELERYGFISSNLSAAASYLTPHLGGIDTTMLSAAQRQELRQSNEAQLKQMEKDVPPEVVEALRPRAAQLRKQNLELVGARLKAAGMTP
jgi:hypothetical protein